jgi:cytidylate kinase
MGHSIIVGRGGNEITRGFHNVINVRLIGSKEQRIRHLVVTHGMELAYAKKFVKGEDAARRRFLKQHFDADINDPERYDIVINTDHLEDDAVVEMLAAAVRRMG